VLFVTIFAVSRVMTSFPTPSLTGIGPIFHIWKGEHNKFKCLFNISGISYSPKRTKIILTFTIKSRGITNRVFYFSMILIFVESCNLHKQYFSRYTKRDLYVNLYITPRKIMFAWTSKRLKNHNEETVLEYNYSKKHS
jgi:hypothetical protein